jgi:hypothetical protein
MYVTAIPGRRISIRSHSSGKSGAPSRPVETIARKPSHFTSNVQSPRVGIEPAGAPLRVRPRRGWDMSPVLPELSALPVAATLGELVAFARGRASVEEVAPQVPPMMSLQAAAAQANVG